MASTFNARDAAVYERSMGRWSRRLAPGFLEFSGVVGPDVLDVGCGTGSLLFELAAMPGVGRVVGIDASEIYARAAQERAAGLQVEVRHGDACAMPFGDGAFDAALSQLVLQFVPEPGAAMAEMQRVVRPGGWWRRRFGTAEEGCRISGCSGTRRRCWTRRRGGCGGKTMNRPMTRRYDLQRLFERAGLLEVVESSVTIWMDFADFADFWQPIAGGEGTLGSYVGGISGEAAGRLERSLRDAYEAGAGDGVRHFACTAFVCRGLVAERR